MANVVWPYEMDRYTANWPADFDGRARRIYVTQREDAALTGAPTVEIPAANVPTVVIHYNNAIPPASDPAGATAVFWLGLAKK